MSIWRFLEGCGALGVYWDSARELCRRNFNPVGRRHPAGRIFCDAPRLPLPTEGRYFSEPMTASISGP